MELNLTIDKKAYRYGEKISATLNLVNMGPNDVIVKNRMIPGPMNGVPAYRDVAFFIADNNNGHIPFIGKIRVRAPKKELFVTLSDKQNIERTVDISQYYYFGEVKALSTKEYSIYAVYYNDYSLPDYPLPWLGEIKSSEVSFTLTFK